MIRGDFGAVVAPIAVAVVPAVIAAVAAASTLTILTGEASLLLARKLVVSSLITRGASSRLDSSADFSWTMTMGDRSRVDVGFDDRGFDVDVDEEEEDDLDSRSMGIVRSSDDEDDDDSDVDDDKEVGKGAEEEEEEESILGDVTFAGGEGGFAETVEAGCGGS